MAPRGMVKMARNAWHFFAKPLHYGIIDHKDFFTRRLECLNGLVSDLFMTLPPIQIFTAASPDIFVALFMGVILGK